MLSFSFYMILEHFIHFFVQNIYLLPKNYYSQALEMILMITGGEWSNRRKWNLPFLMYEQTKTRETHL
jgi:hypothetical protein